MAPAFEGLRVGCFNESLSVVVGWLLVTTDLLGVMAWVVYMRVLCDQNTNQA